MYDVNYLTMRCITYNNMIFIENLVLTNKKSFALSIMFEIKYIAVSNSSNRLPIFETQLSRESQYGNFLTFVLPQKLVISNI